MSFLARSRQRSQQATGRVRIIGGDWRGRRLSVPALTGLRPTPDRVRETLFNWLQMTLPGSDCLDAFAGSGALGFEAASRGARQVTLIERDPPQARLLQEQALVFAAGNIEIHAADAISWLQQTQARFDFIFLDPPFAGDLLDAALSVIADRAILRTDGLVYVEQSRGATLADGWLLHRQTRAGQVEARLLKQAASDA